MRTLMSVAAFCILMSASTASSSDLADRLLQMKQTAAMFDNMLPVFEAALKRKTAYTEIPAAQQKKILETAERIYRQKNLFEVFQAAYITFSDERIVKAELKFLNGKVGKLLANAMADETQTDFDTRRQKYFQKRSFKNLPANRKNSLESYIKTSKKAEMIGSLHLGMDIGVEMALNAFKKDVYRKSIKEIKIEGRQRHSNYIIDNSEEMMTRITYSHRSLSNAQLDFASKFYFSRTGENTVSAYMKAFEITFDRAAKTLMDSLILNK